MKKTSQLNAYTYRLHLNWERNTSLGNKKRTTICFSAQQKRTMNNSEQNLILYFILFLLSSYCTIRCDLSFVFYKDNHAAHHVNGMEEILQPAGALVLLLPPYWAEWNTVEGIFFIMEAWLCEKEIIYLITASPQEIILRTFLHIGRIDVQAM